MERLQGAHGRPPRSIRRCVQPLLAHLKPDDAPDELGRDGEEAGRQQLQSFRAPSFLASAEVG